jgi:hypothetical protein
MNTVLDIFENKITHSGDTITILYYDQSNLLGECVYERCEMMGTTKKFKRIVHLLTSTKMEEVIEELYNRGKISGPGDLQKMNYEIKVHSRELLENYLGD